MKSIVGMMALTALAGCQQRAVQNPTIANGTQPVGNVQIAPDQPARVAKPDRTSLPEPKGPIDPRSVEAAGQVVQHYGALIEQDRFAEAAKIWGDSAAAAAFAKQLQAQGLKHLEIGELGDPEGAAGSIYVTMPVVFYGGSTRKAADIVLRRVNDVPGSTEAQRRWHIDRVEWTA